MIFLFFVKIILVRSSQPNMHPVLVPKAVCYVSGPEPNTENLFLAARPTIPGGPELQSRPSHTLGKAPPRIWEAIFRTRFLENETTKTFQILNK